MVVCAQLPYSERCVIHNTIVSVMLHLCNCYSERIPRYSCITWQVMDFSFNLGGLVVVTRIESKVQLNHVSVSVIVSPSP